MKKLGIIKMPQKNKINNIDDLINKIRDEVEKLKFESQQSQIKNEVDLNSIINFKFSKIQDVNYKLQKKTIYDIGELVSYWGSTFINNAYHCLLEREPDAKGYLHYLSSLEKGNLSKIEILGQIRYSEEGKIKAIKVEGLKKSYMLQRLYRVPVIGYGIKLFRILLNLPMILKDQEKLISQLFNNKITIETNNCNLEIAVKDYFTELQKKFIEHDHVLSNEITELANNYRLLFQDFQNKVMDLERGQNKNFNDFKLETTNQLNSITNQLEMVSKQNYCYEVSIAQHQENISNLLEEVRNLSNQFFLFHKKNEELQEDGHFLDDFYVTFEDKFRGSKEDIKERVSIYVATIINAKAGSDEAKILDIGCGRGEFLEVLESNSLHCIGVDQNRAMIQKCLEMGLKVIESQAITYLRELPNNSLGAVTGLHIIEHIPFKALIVLFDEVLRVLKPGGVVIFETPNPENLIVGSCSFYVDPTHIKPLPPELMKFLMESRGFSKVEVNRLHPNVQMQVENEHVDHVISNLLFGAQDYALVAYKI